MWSDNFTRAKSKNLWSTSVSLQGFEMRAKYPLDLGDRVRVEKSFMTKRDDRFRFGAGEMAARIGDHAVGSSVQLGPEFSDQ